MGEAKRKALAGYASSAPAIISPIKPDLIYHWTSSLKLHQIQNIDGHINIERAGMYSVEMESGVVAAFPGASRDLTVIPGLVWFTDRRAAPPTMAWSRGGEALGAKRIGLAFAPDDIGAISWLEYSRRETPSGESLEITASQRGDDPRSWWISETPVDMTMIKEIVTG